MAANFASPWDANHADPCSLGGIVQPVGEDPGGIAPPPSARRLSAFRLADGSMVARYEWSGLAAEAEAHYRKALVAAGFSVVTGFGTDAAETRPRMVFRGPLIAGTVILRKDPSKGTIRGIAVTITPFGKTVISK